MVKPIIPHVLLVKMLSQFSFRLRIEFMLNESIDKSINGAFFKNYFKSRVWVVLLKDVRLFLQSKWTTERLREQEGSNW